MGTITIDAVVDGVVIAAPDFNSCGVFSLLLPPPEAVCCGNDAPPLAVFRAGATIAPKVLAVNSVGLGLVRLAAAESEATETGVTVLAGGVLSLPLTVVTARLGGESSLAAGAPPSWLAMAAV